MENDGAAAGLVDLDKTTVTLEPEKPSTGGLYVPGKDRMVYVAPERKSRLGLDTPAIAKRGESQLDGAFKVPKEKTISIAATAEDEDKSESSIVVDDSEHGGHAGTRRHANRRYRESTSESSHADSSLTDDRHGDTYRTRHSTDHIGSDVPASPSGYDREDRRSERRHSGDDSSSSRGVRHANRYESKESYSERDSHSRYDREYGRKRNRYEGSRRTPDRSDWDDGRWEWEDTPRRDGVSSSRRYQPSPSPMFVGASPDAR